MTNSITAAGAACLIALLTQTVSAKADDLPGVIISKPLKTVTRTTGYPLMGAPASYSTLIKTYARQYGVPVDLAHAVVRVESNFNPKARGGAGEIGLMQIKPATARMMGYQGSAKGLYDPETNIKFGMKYLAAAHDLSGGTTCGTILKYNAGHGAKRMNPVSKRYCGKVQSLLDS
ncbi:lytic transglycosylase domain-containing protein [Rhizobium sp. ARZ01]|uniref:lytic transglycosylase domain-containing protein n=1 Tax=Rhizobium sp. ARZ01 TaxID=2769313 RepID=UPI00177C468C|nr:lytic transglycosylase domain-containing protein [Rhizobium sp. ARZ01]MBD9372914.1 lytic transglycosylase domain-containing protein [Rhizobium sp. ARZ01]